MATPIPETELLVPVDANDRDAPDIWPTFYLTSVHVIDGDGHAISLLGLSDDRPRKLFGRVKALAEDQAHLLRRRSLRRAPCIEVDVTRSYFRQDDGIITIHAAGEAGWYSLQPSEEYQAIWNDMQSAIEQFLWIVNAHRKGWSSKNGRQVQSYQDWPVEQLFEEYGKECLGRPKMASEATQKMFKHKEFLLESMLSGHGNIDWTKTPIYHHLAKKFPKQHRAAMAYAKSTAVVKNHNALPIRETTMPKRKREQGVGKATHTQPPRTSRTTSEQAGGELQQALPSTPKADPVRDRRRFAVKGMSALRPSAVKPREQGLQGPSSSAELHRGSGEDETDSGESDLDTPGVNARFTAPQPEPVRQKRAAEGSPDLDEAATQSNVWICSIVGCSHKISAASEPDLQMLTEEHISLHAFDNDARVRLVQQLEHSSLPVSHLMERVRYQARAEQATRSRAAGP